MKRRTLLAATLCMALSASAQSVMRIHNTDGSVTVVPVEQIEYIDFDESADVDPSAPSLLGGEANCYIVDHHGTYAFKATLVDGTPVAAVDHVSWLWREKADAPIVEDDVAYDARSNTVTFTAGAAEGNAVLAAVGADGQIVWIWHIWSTDRPVDKTMGDNMIMDRYLGAVSASPEDGRDTWGLVYQYGRNVPFYFIGDNQEYNPKEAMDQANKFTEINPEFSGMKWKVSSAQRTEGYSLAESMANPMTHMMHKYVAGSNGGYHWAKDTDVFDLVWASDKSVAKTNYDPCPKGYKVPMSDEIDFSDITYEPNSSFDMVHPTPGFFVDDQWWPMNTGRHYEDGCALYGGEAQDYCDRLFLWTAYGGPYEVNFYTKYKFCPIRIVVENDYTKGNLRVTNPTAGTGAFGHAVRCVRETPATRLPSALSVDSQVLQSPDFALTLPDGTAKALSALTASADYTLLYFNNPDCHACRETKDALERSAVLRSRMAAGELNVVSVYTDDEPELWRSHLADYPASWTVALDAAQCVLTEGLYDLSRTPALYLVDRQGRILLSDAPLTAIEALIK